MSSIALLFWIGLFLARLYTSSIQPPPEVSQNTPPPEEEITLEFPAFPKSGTTQFWPEAWIWYTSLPSPEQIAKTNSSATVKLRTNYSDGKWFYDSLWLEWDETNDQFQVIYATKEAPFLEFIPAQKVSISWTGKRLIIK